MHSRQLASLLLFTFLLCHAIARGQGLLPEKSAAVEMQITGADGKLVGNAAVEVAYEGDFVAGRKKTVLKLTSDPEGWVRFPWHLGVSTFRVRVPGIGYSTTSVVVRADATARAHLPRLVAYGKISGVVPEKMRQPEMSFEIKDWPSNDILSRATCDAEGRFTLTDVPPGSYWLRHSSKDKAAKIEAPVRVSAGQTVSEVAFQLVVDSPAQETPTKSIEEQIAYGKKTAVWVTGRVVDVAGDPVAGAEVFAIITWIGVREIEETESARTDALGNWQIEGQSRHSGNSGFVLVAAEGRPSQSVVLPHRSRKETDEQELPPTVRDLGDIVLPTRGGSLTVRVKENGMPVPGASVFLLRETAFRRNLHGHSDSDVDALRSHEILSPIADTDEQGIAHFSNLVPGSYTIRAAIDVEKKYIRYFLSHWNRPFINNPHGRWGSARGVRVGMRDTALVELVLDQPNYLSSVRIVRGDGKPLVNDRLAESWRRPNESGVRSSSSIVKGDSRLELGPFDDPGLWLVAFQDADYKIRSTTIRWPPYHEAQGIVACSTLLKNLHNQLPTIVLHTMERKARSLIVRLEDNNGKPLKGEVFLARSFGERCGTTNEEGEIRFENLMIAGEVTAELTSQSLPLLTKQKSLPSDDALIGKQIFLNQQIEYSNLATTTMTMRAIRVGYVRGKLHPTPPRTVADYELFTSNASVMRPAWNVQYDPQTGEFVAGPFAEGRQAIQLGFKTPDGKAEVCPIPDVEVRNDQVVNVTWTPHPSDEKTRSQFSPFRFLSQQLQGTVVAADGEKEVLGATVALFLPKIDRAVDRCDADERGRYLLAPNSIPSRQPTPPENGIAVPTLVARIPGSCGAVVLALVDPAELQGQPLNLVLPKPQSLRGRVTVAKEKIESIRATFVVRAQYLGHAELNDELSIETTPSLDGTFEIGGLTPGKYQIQAAMDNIWLSETVAMDVLAEPTGFNPIELSIPAPGHSTTLELTDPEGQPLMDHEVILHRPAGPLTERLWPKSLRSDGAGRVQIPPLEVGTHRITFGGSDTVAEIEVPPLCDKPAAAKKIAVKANGQRKD